MDIIRLPVLSDNYVFILVNTEEKTAAVVDPAVAQPVIDYLNQAGVELTTIFNTHHHFDHVGGNEELINAFPDVCVYGGAEDNGRIPGQRVFLKEGDKVEFAGRKAEVFFVPGHTRAHIAYYFPPTEGDDIGELFCGDTLFAGGCGRLFEGTPAQMVNSLTKLRSLPDNTRVWCAHEYTLKNLQFAVTVDSGNQDLQTRFTDVKEARSRWQPTVPSLLGLEKVTNPFLRWDTSALQIAMNSKEAATVFGRLRGRKDVF